MKVTVKVPKPASKTWSCSGKTLEEAFEALEKHGWWGRYRSNGKVDWSLKNKKVVSVSISAKPEVVMPSWKGYSKATPEEKAAWDAMWVALETHEMNHHTIFEDAVKAFEKELKAADEMDAKTIKEKAKAFETETQAAQDRYDSSSGNGKKEGVELVIPAP